MVAETASIPDLQTAWARSTMTEAKIQALVDRELLWPKAELEWRAAAGEQFPSEDVKEQVVFTSFFERGFNLLVGDFFQGLLYYYNLELVHLVPNSIAVVSTFLHFCEAYLGYRLTSCFVVEVLVVVDRHRSPRQHCWVEVGMVLYCRSTSWASTSYWP
jgi:hypothetical protein